MQSKNDSKKTGKDKPTEESYGELQLAYDHFNKELFGGNLPPCLFTFQRRKSTYGYFSPNRFANDKGVRTHEIAMNPSYFAVVPVTKTLQTIAHEMTHLWHHHNGTPGRRGYHNLEWARKMEEIGLMPSNTGKPGGKKTGEQMDDYIIKGGRFEIAAKSLLSGSFGITWKDRFPDRESLRIALAPSPLDTCDGSVNVETDRVAISTLEALGIQVDQIQAPDNTSNRHKYSCPECGINAWGKPDLKLVCGDCDIRLEERFS